MFSAILMSVLALVATQQAYDPLACSQDDIQTLKLTVTDSRREREIPVLVYLPARTSPAPVVLFSHGLGGSRMNNAYLGRHWAGRGYAAVMMQHPGSDESVWRNVPPEQRMDALQAAASAGNYLLRVADVPAVLDELERCDQSTDHPLAGRLDLTKVGMSGYSFGAQTTQGLCGQRGLRGSRFTDARIKVAIILSPSAPRNVSASHAFGGVSIPWLLMTGTHDVSIIGDADAESRLAVFEALPPGAKYELVLHDAEHSAFGDRALPGDRLARNPNHHREIKALTTAFLDAYLLDDPAAKDWMDGDGPCSVLEPEDRWRAK